MDSLSDEERTLAWLASWNPSFEGKAIVNADFTFRRVNHQFCKILSVTPADLLKNKFTDLTPEPMRGIAVKNCILVRRGDIQSFLLPSILEFSGKGVDITLLVNGVYHPTSKHFLFFVVTMLKGNRKIVTPAQSPKWTEYVDIKSILWKLFAILALMIALVLEKLFGK